MSTKPIKKFVAGAVSVSIFENSAKGRDGQPTTFRSVVLQRRYKDKSGNWQSTNGYRTNDLPKVVACLEEAYKFLLVRNVETGAEEHQAEEDMIEEVI